jgi:hypothetical protein
VGYFVAHYPVPRSIDRKLVLPHNFKTIEKAPVICNNPLQNGLGRRFFETVDIRGLDRST